MKKMLLFIFALIISFSSLFGQSTKTLVSTYKVDAAKQILMDECKDITFVQNESLPLGTIRVHLIVSANCDAETLTSLCKKGRYFAQNEDKAIVLGVEDTKVFFGRDRQLLEEYFRVEIEMSSETSLLAAK